VPGLRVDAEDKAGFTVNAVVFARYDGPRHER
jgi:hypothetical protein